MTIFDGNRADFFAWLISFGVLISLIAELHSQESPVTFAEQELAGLDSKLASFQSRRSELDQQAKSLAEQIKELKGQGNLSFFQRQRLNRLLKESQDVANAIESIDSEVRSLSDHYSQIGKRLIELYDDHIEKILKELETQSLSQDRGRSSAKQIEDLRRKKDELQRKLRPQTIMEMKLVPLEIEAEDSPKRIEQKADLMKDQQEKLLRLADQLLKRGEEAAQELAIKTRISDLITDLAVFDQQEETLSNLRSSGSAVRSLSEDLANTNSPDEDRAVGQTDRPQRNLFVGQKAFDFADVSPEQLEQTIELLRNQSQQLKAQADSLGQQARRFYETAKEMKKQ
jgi:chromosome segregation ATPase